MPVHPGASWIDRLAESLPAAPWRTRFAPAPTGYLHLGHLVNAIHVWGVARAHGGEVVLRIEDHDRTRCRPEYEAALLEDLDWLGLVPDHFGTASFRADPQTHPARQSNQSARYAAALADLAAQSLVYACRCTRRDIERVAPHAPGEEPRYPGTCRALDIPATDTFARRVRLAPQSFTFADRRLGTITQCPADQCGDVLVKDRHDQWTYQFAVTVDDLTHEIDVVIRGEDLLSSTGRQLQLATLLGRTRPLTFLHHTLLVHPDGSKLSKASYDTALRDLRVAGATAPALLGLAACRAGLIPKAQPLPVEALPTLFA